MKRMDYLEFKSLMDSFGITDPHFIAPLYSQLGEADGLAGDGVEFAAAVIRGSNPHDQLEVMQVAQMAVMHWASGSGDERAAVRITRDPPVRLPGRLWRTSTRW
jgi:hypothetical protein